MAAVAGAGLVHVRGVRAGGGELLDPHAVHDLHGAAARRARSSSPRRRAPRPASRAAVMPALVVVGGAGPGEHLRPDPESRRRHDQQRLVRRRPRLDPDDRMLGGARETARSADRSSRRRGRAHERAPLVAWPCWQRSRWAVALSCRLRREQGRRRAARPSCLAEPPGGARSRAALPRPLRDARRTRLAARPGRRHGRRGPGVRNADGGRDRRREALRPIWDWTQGQPAAPGRADLVPLEGRQGGGPTGGLRRRPGRRPRAARRRLPLQPARVSSRRRCAWARRSCATRRSVRGPGHGRCWSRVRGRASRRSRSNPSYFSPATFAALRAASGDGRWGSLAASSRAITGKLMPSAAPAAAGLGAARGRQRPCRSARPGNRERAARVRLRCRRARSCGWPRIRTRPAARSPPGRGRCSRAQGPPNMPVEHDLSGQAGRAARCIPMVLVARGGRGGCGRPAGGPRPACSTRPRRSTSASPTYYGAAWVALGRIMLTTQLLDCS